MFQRPVIAIAVILISGQIFASDELSDNVCLSDKIKSITLPIYSDKKKSKSPEFVYKYYFQKPTTEDSPVIIFIPGGPGQTSIDRQYLLLPGNFGVIYTDPRGIGCNKNPNLKWTSDQFSTKLIAADISAIIKDAGLKKYIIYGTSFGTAVALMTTKLIEENDQVENPVATVLEGVIGRSIETEEEALGRFKNLWKEAFNSAQPGFREEFTTNENPKGLTGEDWGKLIRGQMLRGKDHLVAFLNFLYPRWGAELKQKISPVQDAGSRLSASGDLVKSVVDDERNLELLYGSIACGELYKDNPELNRNFVIKGGELSFGYKSVCRGTKTREAFDSRKWQVSTHIYYFSGSDDPLTPLWQRDYHVQNQLNAKKTVVTVKGAGHSPLRDNLGINTNQVWESIANGGQEFKAFVDGTINSDSFERVTVENLDSI